MEEFKTLLRDYRISAESEKILTATPLVLLVGPSSSGRNTIINELVKTTGKYHYIISDTTRPMRVKNGVPIEKNGREYWFRSADEVLEDVRQGKFLEAALIHEQQVSGVSIREVMAARKEHAIAITDVEIAGAETIHRIKPDAKVLFVVPPDFDSWMQRLRPRSDLAEAEIRRRLEGACREFRAVLKHDYYTVVINDNLQQAIADVHTLSTTDDYSKDKAQKGRELVQHLLQVTEDYLAQLQQG